MKVLNTLERSCKVEEVFKKSGKGADELSLQGFVLKVMGNTSVNVHICILKYDLNVIFCIWLCEGFLFSFFCVLFVMLCV